MEKSRIRSIYRQRDLSAMTVSLKAIQLIKDILQRFTASGYDSFATPALLTTSHERICETTTRETTMRPPRIPRSVSAKRNIIVRAYYLGILLFWLNLHAQRSNMPSSSQNPTRLAGMTGSQLN